jgi:hypothetical protein
LYKFWNPAGRMPPELLNALSALATFCWLVEKFGPVGSSAWLSVR